MVPTKVKYSYANLRRLPQFSDDAITAVNHLLVTNHILQNYTLEPALGLQNYSLFSAAVKNSIELNLPSAAVKNSNELNLPCLPPFHKQQPWLDAQLSNLRHQYSHSRAQYLTLGIKPATPGHLFVPWGPPFYAPGSPFHAPGLPRGIFLCPGVNFLYY